MRLSRCCYDKPNRCPGWAGGGTRYAKVQRCDNGLIAARYGDIRHADWKFLRCNTCDVVTLPYVTRWFDWWWWVWAVRDWRRDIARWRESRRRRSTRRAAGRDVSDG